MINLIYTIISLVGLVFVWGVTFLTLHTLNMNNIYSTYGNGTVLLLAAAIMVPGAVLLSGQILRLVAGARTPFRRSAGAAVESLTMRDLVALLDDEDLDDLRAEAREVLRARIRRLSDGDQLESFEDLLEVAGKRKRSVR